MCIHVCACCQLFSTQKTTMGEDKRLVGDITCLLGAHFITMEVVVGN